MKHLVGVVALIGCLGPSRPPPPNPYGDPAAHCKGKVYELTVRCDQATAQRQPELVAEMLRGELTTFAPTCGRALAGVERCVAQLEASFATDDPERAQRRAAAASRAEATRAKPAYRRLVAELIEVRDAIEIQCRRRSASPADERECGRWEARGTTAAKRLEAYLQGEGFDRRDYNAFELWPGGVVASR